MSILPPGNPLLIGETHIPQFGVDLLGTFITAYLHISDKQLHRDLAKGTQNPIC
jgi:hypothetical protein